MRLSASLEVMKLDLEKHIGLDPHVETSREELELGLPPSVISDALEVQNPVYRLDKPTVMDTGNSGFVSAGPNGRIRASSTSTTDLQQAELVFAVDGPDSHPDIMPGPRTSICDAALKGTGVEDDLLKTVNLTSDEVYQGETAVSRQPRNAVPTSYSILPVDRLTGILKYMDYASKDASPIIICHENDVPVCKVTQDEKHHERVSATTTIPGNGPNHSFLQKGVPETLSVECPKAIFNSLSVHKEHSIGDGCAGTGYSGPTEAAQRLQVESQGQNLVPRVSPTTFSGLFQSIIASESPSSQLVEAARLSNRHSATSSIVPTVNKQHVQDIVNTTTRLMLDGLNQPPLRIQPPALLQGEKVLESTNRTKVNTSVLALGTRPSSLQIQSASQMSYREARVASAATTASAAASAAKSAVEAAEASIEAIAQLGINNGSLYQGRNSFANPRPLKVACGSRPVAVGVKRTFQDQRPQSVEQTGGMSKTGTLDLITSGSTVEVMPKEDGLQGGWFIAKVLSMTPKEARVVYDDLITDDGCSHLEESFPLHCSREGDTFGTTVPGAQGWIRPVHPFSSSYKRGHFTTVYESLVVGDHVDAFVEDGWWEGIIEVLNEADETKITVYFPGDGSTMVVKAWNVRPSLIWKKGEWRPCRGDSVEQDCPPSKRQRTSTINGKVEKEQSKTSVATARNPLQAHKRTPKPLAITPSRQLLGSSRNDNKSMVMHAIKAGTGQSSVTPVRELRSGTRSNASTALTLVLVNSSSTPSPRRSTVNASASKDTENCSSPLTRSQQMLVAVTPEASWDVKRLSTRLQQKEVSQSPQDSVKCKTPTSRSEKKEVLDTPRDTGIAKTYTRRSKQKKSIEAPQRGLAQVTVPLPKEEPQTRSRTRSSQRLAAKKR